MSVASRSTARRAAAVAAVVAMALSISVGAQAAKPPAAMLTGLGGAQVQVVITVGDVVHGYRFEAIPDGISIARRSASRIDVYVNHETSTVPFPYTLPNPDINNSKNDFDNAQLSRLVLKNNLKVVSGQLVIDSDENFQRFCSNFLTHGEDGFEERQLLFTNEETSDTINRTGQAWPAGPPYGADTEQAGVVVAYDPATGDHTSIYGLGRANHENSVAIPGYGQAVLLTGDDTFTAPSSQAYMYTASDADAVWNDQGHLFAFQSDDPAVNDYGDLPPGATVAGQFIAVPDSIADGDQTGLETWSNDNNVFQFIRIEDIAYDRDDPNVVYLADTGEPRAIPDPNTGRLMRGPSGTQGPYPNGRIFRMELDPTDPYTVDSLSVLFDGDGGGYNNPSVLHQPDNLETVSGHVLITEDPGGHNNYLPSDPNGTTARIWAFDLASGTASVVARVDQALDPNALLGSWEASGIVDASAAFGPGAFLVAVQAHSIFVETAPGPDLIPPPGPDWLYKREGGQLLLIRIPGL
jgi:hypothetical protein